MGFRLVLRTFAVLYLFAVSALLPRAAMADSCCRSGESMCCGPCCYTDPGGCVAVPCS